MRTRAPLKLLSFYQDKSNKEYYPISVELKSRKTRRSFFQHIMCPLNRLMEQKERLQYNRVVPDNTQKHYAQKPQDSCWTLSVQETDDFPPDILHNCNVMVRHSGLQVHILQSVQKEAPRPEPVSI